MNSCSPDFLCIAYTLVCESQFMGDFIRMRVTCTAKWGLQIAEMIFRTRSRACLKKAFRELRVPVCGRFYPNEGGVAGYGNRMRVKYTAKWGLQIAEMIFQTRSSTSFRK